MKNVLQHRILGRWEKDAPKRVLQHYVDSLVWANKKGFYEPTSETKPHTFFYLWRGKCIPAHFMECSVHFP